MGAKIAEGSRGKPPFISIPRVYLKFDFRVLRQNRRIVSEESRRDELENFHQAGVLISRAARLAHAMGASRLNQVLFDVPNGQPTERVRDFIVQTYVRGAKCGCADRSGFEKSTAVFTKRGHRVIFYGRYRPRVAMSCPRPKRPKYPTPPKRS